MLGRGFMGHYIEYVLSSTLSICITLVAIVLNEYNAVMLLYYATVDFHLFYDVAADMQIWTLLTRSLCKVSDTQVTAKNYGPLFNSGRPFLGHHYYILSLSDLCLSADMRINVINQYEWLICPRQCYKMCRKKLILIVII